MSKKRNSDENIHNSVKFVVIISNCIGLLPVGNIFSRNVNNLNFRWKSLKVAYTLMILFCVSLFIIFVFIEAKSPKFVYDNISKCKIVLMNNQTYIVYTYFSWLWISIKLFVIFDCLFEFIETLATSYAKME